MPVFNPGEPGDVLYPKYAVVTTEPINDSLQVEKGKVYTKNASGFLILAVADLVNGFYQAMVTPENPGAAGGADTVQVLGPRTRMTFLADVAGLVPGQDVIMITDSVNITGGPKTDALYIGKIFEIYDTTDPSQRKYVTDIGDKVIVETVQP